MGQIFRKGGERSAPGWRFSRAVKAWCCDQHGSVSCAVCPRPEHASNDEREWWIDREGIAMPVPTQADLLPNEPVLLSALAPSEGHGMASVQIGIDMVSREVADITGEVAKFCDEKGDGLVNVLLSHATAGLAIVELGHGTEHDVIQLLERLAPQDQAYVNACGKGNEGSDHLLPVLLSASLTLPVLDGRPALGGSQSIVLVDRFYGMGRRVRLSFIAA